MRKVGKRKERAYYRDCIRSTAGVVLGRSYVNVQAASLMINLFGVVTSEVRHFASDVIGAGLSRLRGSLP